MTQLAGPGVDSGGTRGGPWRPTWRTSVAAVGAIVLALLIYDRYGHGPVEVSEPLEHAAVATGVDGVTVTNNDNDPWLNVRLELNSGAFTCRVRRIEPHQPYMARFASFSDKDGKLFDPSSYEVRQFGIRIFKDPWPSETGDQRYAAWIVTPR